MGDPTTPPRPAVLVPLEGTPRQVTYGESVRRSMMAVLGRCAPPDVLERLDRVKDATWWIANKGKPLAAIRWPAPHQREDVEPRQTTSPCSRYVAPRARSRLRLRFSSSCSWTAANRSSSLRAGTS